MRVKTPSVLEKGLPVNIDAERFVLASIMAGGNAVLTVAVSVLEPADFALDNHQSIFRVMRELDAAGVTVDRVHVAEFLQRQNLLESITLSFLLDLDDSMPRIPDISGYLRIVKEKSTLRKTIYACRAIANRCIAASEDSADVLQSAEKLLAGLATDSEPASRWWSPTQVIEQYPGGLAAFITPSRNGAGVPFPWPSLTDQTCGMQRGDMIVLAARPSMGKSAAALQISAHAAKCGFPPAVISLEMERDSLIRRLISMKAGVDSQRMRMGFLNPGERQRIAKAVNELEQFPVWIDDTRNVTHEAIRQSLKRRAAQAPIGLIVVDHFHLVRGHRGQEMREHFAETADAMQGWPKEFGCPLLVLAQVGRDCEKENRPPSLSDLKETGKLEENADLVAFIHRPEMYAKNRGREDLKGIAQGILAKQRNGPTGVFQWVWLAGTQEFVQRAEEESYE